MNIEYPKDQKAPPDDDVTLRLLVAKDAVALASLLAAYGDEMRHGQGAGANALTRADALIADPIAEVLGGFLGAELVAFAVFFDLPEAISGGRSGQLDDLYVLPAARETTRAAAHHGHRRYRAITRLDPSALAGPRGQPRCHPGLRALRRTRRLEELRALAGR